MLWVGLLLYVIGMLVIYYLMGSYDRDVATFAERFYFK
jgi:hypothetical protein